ncbi:MAG: ABC transporter ATP-binding protein [Melioribacteraceae bacterium]
MIVISKVSKNYSVKKVLDNINITVPQNSIYCLLGKNGAGKTTLINIMSDFIKPDAGEIFFDNMNYNANELEIKRNMGVLSEANYLIEELTGYEYLTFVGKLYGIPKKELKNRIESLAVYFFESVEEIKKVITHFSTGMKKKLMFCSAVIHKPRFLLLDEPFEGLDPVASNLLIEFLNRYKINSRVIFLSSHNLDYIEKVATHIAVLDNSKIIFDGTLSLFLDNGTKNIDESLLSKLNDYKPRIKEVEWAF